MVISYWEQWSDKSCENEDGHFRGFLVAISWRRPFQSMVVRMKNEAVKAVVRRVGSQCEVDDWFVKICVLLL